MEHIEPVIEPVIQHDASEIESQILAAFSPMDVDPVFNPTVPDLEPEQWDPYFTVDSFKSLTSPHAWYIMPQVHVYYVWTDNKSNKLYLFVHDKHGEMMAAVVPQDLVEEYKNKNLEDTFVSIHHFQIEYINPTEYPRHNNYSFVQNDVLIVVNSKMVVSQILFPDMTGFVNHPWLPSIRGLLEDKSTKKMLIDTVGRVIRGDLKKHAGYNTCELFLRDLTGTEIKFIAFYTLRKEYAMLARVIKDKGVIYITRVKLVHAEPINLLMDTKLSGVNFDPDMRQAQALKKMRI